MQSGSAPATNGPEGHMELSECLAQLTGSAVLGGLDDKLNRRNSVMETKKGMILCICRWQHSVCAAALYTIIV